jgi:DNA-directed RNA polymerase specialized sigma24 family protein
MIEAHIDEVHRFLSRLAGGDEALTEDLLQEVFVTVLQRQPQHRPE